ncbi:MAG: rhodanese-like domain-containing protein [Anaerolineales bacterium]|nr:rhodanese-like domain-containing protein [Anaerolineales bacterium]
MEIQLSRREMLFKIARLLTSRLLRGEFALARVPEITAEALYEKMQSGQRPLLIDTRGREEFRSGFGHLPEAQSIPLMEIVVGFASPSAFKTKVKELEEQLRAVEAHQHAEMVTICPGGGFSLVAAEILAEAGFTDVKSLAGGADGWFKKGYPTTKEME